MKVTFVLTPAFDPNEGGVQRTTYKLGKYFTENGIDVTYYSLSNTGNKVPEYGKLYYSQNSGGQDNQQNIIHLKQAMQLICPHIVINQMPYEVSLRNALAELKTELQFKLIGCLRNSLFSVKNNLKDYTKAILPAPLNKLFDNNLGHYLFLQLHKNKHAKQLRAILDIHDYYVLLAPPNENELKYFVKDYKSHKVVSIPNSIPFIDTGVPDKKKVILHVGRIVIEQKRADLLLDFWGKTFRSLPEWEFWIVGEGSYKEKMESQIVSENLERVKLLGKQKPEEFYKSSSVFVMTSAFEGFPNVILEAQSYGVVPVAFNTYPVLNWLVNDNKDAILIAAFDTTKMADKVIELCNNQSNVFEMSEQAKLNASKFTIDKVGRIWLNFFDKVIHE